MQNDLLIQNLKIIPPPSTQSMYKPETHLTYLCHPQAIIY